MISRKQIEEILVQNGISHTSPDEVIRSVLISAQFSEDDVETAVMVLRKNTTTDKSRVDGLHKVFRTNDNLNSSEISQLLGIDVQLGELREPQQRVRSVSSVQTFLILILSIMLCGIGLLVYMYISQTGVFHPSAPIIKI